MYTKQFEIRWNDIDSNVHLRNSAYVDYMSHTRMSYFSDMGFNQKQLFDRNLGPVALYEHMYYFREVLPGSLVTVTLQWKGVSKDGVFFSLLHEFYDDKGKNVARCEMLGAWIDLKTRKLTQPPKSLWMLSNGLDKTDDFKELTKADLRKHGQLPKDL